MKLYFETLQETITTKDKEISQLKLKHQDKIQVSPLNQRK